MRIGRAHALVTEWWRRLSMLPKHVLLRRVGVLGFVGVVGSIALAKLTWGSSGPGIATPFAFAALFVAAVALMAVAVVHSQDLVDELEASHPPRVRNRGAFARVVNPMLWTASARLRRAFREWRARVASTLRREATRDSLTRRLRAVASALSGVPPGGLSPAAAGSLARPIAARGEPRPRRIDEHHRAVRRSHPREEALAALDRLRGHRRGRPHRAAS
ncbi:MAG TPA: hypothetical protein VEM59_10075 [Acidimicrobiia bacterium]|nr:hypothetical protein [Acidimicrobiia bacterium]